MIIYLIGRLNSKLALVCPWQVVRLLSDILSHIPYVALYPITSFESIQSKDPPTPLSSLMIRSSGSYTLILILADIRNEVRGFRGVTFSYRNRNCNRAAFVLVQQA